jgi:hypothetical protein
MGLSHTNIKEKVRSWNTSFFEVLTRADDEWFFPIVPLIIFQPVSILFVGNYNEIITRSSVNNLRLILSFKCLTLYGKAGRTSKLKIIQFIYPFRHIISTATYSHCLKFVIYNLKVSHFRHVCNLQQKKKLFRVEFVSAFIIYHRTKFRIHSSTCSNSYIQVRAAATLFYTLL